MKIKKSNIPIPGLSILLLCAILISNFLSSSAQNGPTDNQLLKYELSIDLVPVLDQGQFGKIYFKINNYKEDQLKGAYRIGVSKGIYFRYDEDLSTYPEGTTTSLDNFSHFDTGLFLGYEKFKKIGQVQTYYGLDIIGKYYLEHRRPETSSEDQGIITLGICPFWGIKHYILKNRVSISFEIGWENSLSRNTNQYNSKVFYYTLSELQLPYNFTINYHF